MPTSMFWGTHSEELELPGGVIKEPALYRDCILRFKRTPHFFGEVRMLNCIVQAPALPVSFRGRARRRVGGQNMVFHGGPVMLYNIYVSERPTSD